MGCTDGTSRDLLRLSYSSSTFNTMELFRWRFLLVATVFHTVLSFSQFQGVYGQEVFFPRYVLQIAQDTLCRCNLDCSPGEREPEHLCFSACQCDAPEAIKRKATPICDPGTEQCTCPWPSERLCPVSTKQLCTFDDGVICEYKKKYCANHFDILKPHCQCKEGWIGFECENCDGCNHSTSPFSNNTTTLALGFLLAIVLVVLIVVVIIYYRLRRLPCQKEKAKKPGAKGDPQKTILGNAYSVSGRMPITGQGILPSKRPGILPPDGDTGEIENEYAYAAINEYATITERNSVRPAVPSAPVPSVSAAKSAEPPYYFRLANDEDKAHDNVPITSASATTTTTTNAAPKNISDCYTKVIRKPKEETTKPHVSQYDRLERTNLRPPPNEDNGSPSDNEYGTLGSLIAAEDMTDCKPEINEHNAV